MAAKTGRTKAQIAASVAAATNSAGNEKASPNPVEANMEAYLDSGCAVAFMIPKTVIDAFGITSSTVDDPAPVYRPKPTKTPINKRPDKGAGDGEPVKPGRVFGRTCRAGRLVKLHLTTPIIRSRAGQNMTVRKLYMRVPSVMDNAAILYFIQKSFATPPAAVTIGSRKFSPEDWAGVDKSKLGNKYSSKPWMTTA